MFLEGEFNMSFLSDIQEVTGYVLLVSNYVSDIPLSSLRIIRGRSLFQHDDHYYSLFVALNFKIPDDAQNTTNHRIGSVQKMPQQGIREMTLTSLYGKFR